MAKQKKLKEIATKIEEAIPAKATETTQPSVKFEKITPETILIEKDMVMIKPTAKQISYLVLQMAEGLQGIIVPTPEDNTKVQAVVNIMLKFPREALSELDCQKIIFAETTK